MSDGARIRELVEQALDTGRAPEELCRDAPELLPAVRARLARLARLSAEVDSLFPPAGASPRAEAPEVLPAIPGYAVEGVLGRGGMGVVYRARHLKLGRDVALKMLLAGAYAGPRELTRFLEEARAAANLCHPNIVQVFDVGELEGRPYFTMELLAGGTLAELLGGRPQPAAWAAEHLALLARAVEFAHRSGVVHRDLKPSNVLLARDGTPKIADFGLARRLGEGSTTATGGALGTPSYMAPEQVRGLAQASGPAVDVYALGAILYEMLTGRPPFRSDSALATQVQVLTADPVPPARLVARVPRDLETICLQCLHKDPARRYATATALAEDLARFRRGEPITARPVGALGRAARWVRRNPSRAALVVTALALVTLAASAGAREWTLAARERADEERWSARLATVRELQAAGRFEEARTALARVPEHASPELRTRLAQAQAELDLVERLDALRFGRGQTGRTDRYDPVADAQYEAAFAAAGLALFEEAPERVAQRIAASDVRLALLAALDDWALCVEGRARLARLVEVARRADPDPWRDRVRDPATWEDPAALAELARVVDPAAQPTPLLRIVGSLLGDAEALAFLRRVQRAHPGDFWVNFLLAERLGTGEEAIEYYRAALAVRPDALAILTNLAIALEAAGRLEEAGHLWERVLELAPDSAITHFNFACYQQVLGHAEQVVESTRTALRLDPAHPLAHGLLGHALLALGRFAEAVEALRVGAERLPAGTTEGRTVRADLAEAERLLAAEPRFLALLAGAEPADARERLTLAALASRAQRHALAARLHAEAFAAAPELAEEHGAGARHAAARAAALASQGRGLEPPASAERRAWRGEALQWLWAELAALSAELEGGAPGAEIAATLARWETDPDLAGLRDPEVLATLTTEEREECRALWSEVAALRIAAR
ncbi:MAG TPA: protein kinase [Planctomycetota bacterium]